MKSRNLNFLEPSGPLQACNGTAYFDMGLKLGLSHCGTNSGLWAVGKATGGGGMVNHAGWQSPRGSTVGNKMNTLSGRSWFCASIFKVLRKIIGNPINNFDFFKVRNLCYGRPLSELAAFVKKPRYATGFGYVEIGRWEGFVGVISWWRRLYSEELHDVLS